MSEPSTGVDRDDTSALIVEGATKRFGDVAALLDVDLRIDRGEILGLLGRNGAGKSTLVRIVTGLISPTSGDVQLGGRSPQAAARAGQIGFCSQEISIYPGLSVRGNLRYVGQLAGRSEGQLAEEVVPLLASLDLERVADRTCAHLSGGFRRRVHVAACLITDAPFLVLDEPTAGLDIETRELVVEAVRARARLGASILYTTHDLAEMERLTDRVAILDQGRKRAEGTVDELAAGLGQVVQLEFWDRDARDCAAAFLTDHRTRSTGDLTLRCWVDGQRSVSPLLAELDEQKLEPRRLAVLSSGLETVYHSLVDEVTSDGSEDA